MEGKKYDECPLKAAGFRLEHFKELPSMVIGPDQRCICTEGQRCVNVDKKGEQRCSLVELRKLDYEAMCRRGRQSGWYD